jgi:hypothetical protein
MRRPDLSQDESNLVFGYQESLKEMFPDRNEFLKYPQLKAKKDKLKEFMNMQYEDGRPKDQEMQELVRGTFGGEKWGMDHVMNQIHDRFGPDMEHPDDSSRTRHGDLKKLIDQLQYKMKKSGEPGDALEMLLMEPKGRGLKRMFRKLEDMGYQLEIDIMSSRHNFDKFEKEKLPALQKKAEELREQEAAEKEE